ncbi:MAG: DNA polymerase III subunit delta [Huintestinicola sp.]
MAAIKDKELAAAIKSGDISGVYYIYGSDLYAVSDFKRKMVKAIVKAGDETYNLHEFRGKDMDVEELSEVCENLPVFAPALCVTVSDLDLDTDKLSESKMKLLLETAGNLPDTTVLIFYTANIDICGGKKYPTPKNKKLIDLIAKKGTVCEIPLKSRNEYIRMLSSAASKRGCGMDDRAAGMLYDRCCGDMNMVMGELEKLCSYANGGVVDTAAVELLTPETSDAKAYNLADAAAAGNIGRTMELYHELIANRSDPIYLLYVITGSMLDLYRARIALDCGHGVADAAADFGYPKSTEFRLKNAFSSVRKTSAAHLRKCMEILADADIAMKSGAGAPEIILEEAIVKMISHN